MCPDEGGSAGDAADDEQPKGCKARLLFGGVEGSCAFEPENCRRDFPRDEQRGGPGQDRDQEPQSFGAPGEVRD